MATPTPTTERERERERAVSEVKMEIMDTLPHDIKLTTASSSSASAAANAAAAAAAAGVVRSRITVVCAECKRLKLKCDRRNPCSSCQKRDCVNRCVYSQAAAEKIDVQSLHNRVLVLEAALAQLKALPGVSHTLAASVFPPQFLHPQPHAGPSSATSDDGTGCPSYNYNGSNGNSVNNGYNSHNALNGYNSYNGYAYNYNGLPHNDRALLATGRGGSSLSIPLDDIASIWLADLDLGADGMIGNGLSTTNGGVGMSLSLTPTSGHETAATLDPNAHWPPLMPYYLDTPPIPSAPSTSGSSPPTHQHQPQHQQLQVTPALCMLLPRSTADRVRLLDALGQAMQVHPCVHWPYVRARVESLFRWADAAIGALGAHNYGHDGHGGYGGGNGCDEAGRPSISFFAVAAAGMAVGAHVSALERVVDTETNLPHSNLESERRSPANGNTGSASASVDSRSTDPAALCALSSHALQVFETAGYAHDMDYVVAMLLQLLLMLHDRNGLGMKSGAFPLIGKIVNVARMMGLHNDPDEYPGNFTLFEAEMRRRVWWEVYYYDVFISDAMGHVPLIADNSHTTRTPMALEDDRFAPTSTTMPYADEAATTVSAYLVQKLSLARLVKRMKKEMYRDPLDSMATSESSGELSITIEQAAFMEADVQQWLAELPSGFKLSRDPTTGYSSNSRHIDAHGPIDAEMNVSSTLLAQRCELAIIAHRLILKLYHIFLRQPRPNSSWIDPDTQSPSMSSRPPPPPHQALLGTITAAHAIISAAHVLHTGSASSTAPSSNSPTASLSMSRPPPTTTATATALFYSLSRAVFDASVVCAHATITNPGAIWASVAQTDAEKGLAMLKASSSRSRSKSGLGAGEGEVWEGVIVVERLLAKITRGKYAEATASASPQAPSGSGSGSTRKTPGSSSTSPSSYPRVGKRKREDLKDKEAREARAEAQHPPAPSTFRLPFVGAEVSVEAGPTQTPTSRRPYPINTAVASLVASQGPSHSRNQSQPSSSIPSATVVEHSATATPSDATNRIASASVSKRSRGPALQRPMSDQSDTSTVSTASKASGKGKKAPYPSIGIRVREPKEKQAGSGVGVGINGAATGAGAGAESGTMGMPNSGLPQEFTMSFPGISNMGNMSTPTTTTHPSVHQPSSMDVYAAAAAQSQDHMMPEQEMNVPAEMVPPTSNGNLDMGAGTSMDAGAAPMNYYHLPMDAFPPSSTFGSMSSMAAMSGMTSMSSTAGMADMSSMGDMDMPNEYGEYGQQGQGSSPFSAAPAPGPSSHQYQSQHAPHAQHAQPAQHSQLSQHSQRGQHAQRPQQHAHNPGNMSVNVGAGHSFSNQPSPTSYGPPAPPQYYMSYGAPLPLNSNAGDGPTSASAYTQVFDMQSLPNMSNMQNMQDLRPGLVPKQEYPDQQQEYYAPPAVQNHAYGHAPAPGHAHAHAHGDAATAPPTAVSASVAAWGSRGVTPAAEYWGTPTTAYHAPHGPLGQGQGQGLHGSQAHDPRW